MSLIDGQQSEPSRLSGQRIHTDEEQWPQMPQAPLGRVDPDETAGPEGPQPKRRLMGHQLLMMVCCIPMLVIVGVLVLTGVLGSGAIVYALVCTVMMAAMMFVMPGGKHN
jgi:hypothetical protein